MVDGWKQIDPEKFIFQETYCEIPSVPVSEYPPQFDYELDMPLDPEKEYSFTAVWPPDKVRYSFRLFIDGLLANFCKMTGY